MYNPIDRHGIQRHFYKNPCIQYRKEIERLKEENRELKEQIIFFKSLLMDNNISVRHFNKTSGKK